MNADISREATIVIDALKAGLPSRIDGKQAIIALKEADYQWRQMEWIGWYFEHVSAPILIDRLGGRLGPSIGRTRFDYQREFVWDLKAHPVVTAAGSPSKNAILNDCEAVQVCIRNHGGVGFIIAKGHAEFDVTGEFKLWHDGLKGGISSYEVERMARGARSRARKTAFTIDEYEALFFESQKDVDKAVDEGWLSFFQEGMRNADGSPRRPKYMLDTRRVPAWIRATPQIRADT